MVPSPILLSPIAAPAVGTDASAPAQESVARAASATPAVEQQRSPHPPNDESDLGLSQEELARQQFIDDWRVNIDRRLGGNLSQDPPSRTRTRSLDEDDLPSSPSAASPTRYSSRSKKARQACCDCSRSDSCGLSTFCPCRVARRCCTDCDPELCGDCVNRVGKLPARPRSISTRLADRLHGPRGHAYLPPPPNGSTSTVGPSNGPDERPAAAGTREESTATAATTRTANSSTAGATDSSDEGGQPRNPTPQGAA